MSNAFFWDLQVSAFVFHSSLLIADSENINLVIARDGFPYEIEIVCSFHSGYLDYRGAFQNRS